MEIGVLKEIKPQEHRVGLTPGGVRELCATGHGTFVETMAGAEAGFNDADYAQAGATICKNAEEVFARSKLLVKVKEPQPQEYALLHEDHILFAYLHLAPDPEQSRGLMQSGASCIAYETVTDSNGGLPLLAPMSEVAGRIAIQAAAKCLEKPQGGAGVLLGGVPGVAPANVLVLGGGVVGLNAARMAAGLGAQVTVVDRSLPRLKTIDEMFGPRIHTLFSTTEAIEAELKQAHAVIGAVLIPGGAAPKLVSKQQLALLQKGAVLVDVAIDQGGCFETSRPTTHQNPTFIEQGVVHYCVANMPGAVAKTATMALTNATLPFVLALAADGLNALATQPGLRDGLNVHQGKITHKAVAAALGLPYFKAEDML